MRFLYLIFMFIFMILLTVESDDGPILTIVFKMVVILVGFIIAMQLME